LSPSLRSTTELPLALDNAALFRRLAGARVAVFSDYDGTLTPIVARPDLARLAEDTRVVLERLARRCIVGVISGRDLEDLRSMVRADGVWLAGSHGMEMQTPDGVRQEVDEAVPLRPALTEAADALDRELASLPGAWVERKRFAVAIHFRQVEDSSIPEVEAAIDRVAARAAGLRKTGGKRILELRPDIDWDKGRALWWLCERAAPAFGGLVPIYIGDDVTDEDAFAAMNDDGLGIVVTESPRPTAAHYRLSTPAEVIMFLADLDASLDAAAT
jgi:trehalose-phosphatase